ncbi:MAG TPA: prolipoprotein diacylglyceryl transferase [bacterium]|nr:prolipoprotein diacylglyceryl transferase [bacterium]
MHPVLLRLGPLKLGHLVLGPVLLRWYGAMMGLALILSIPVTAHFGGLFGIERRLLVDSLALPFLLSLLVGARAGFVLSHPQDFVGDPLAIIRPPYAGLASHGAIAVALVYLAVWCPRHRVPLWRLADAMAPAFLLAIMLVRWGNFMNGELYGDPTALPWGTVFPGVPGGPRHPLQLYEIAGTAVILGWALWAARRRAFDGALVWPVIIASSALRFALDLLRSEDRTVVFLSWGQMAALALIVWGAWFLWRHRRGVRAGPGPHEGSGGV